MTATRPKPEIGPLLRCWRLRRGRTQLEVALDAGISARHLSFVETGRSRPSAPVVLLLAEQLDIPVRERNRLLLAAGYAPEIPELSLEEPEMAPVREAVEVVLDCHEPNPAVVIDRHWNMVAANAAMAGLSAGVDPALLEPPVNVMRVGLHPRGLARQIVNLDEVQAYFVGRLERQVAATADRVLAGLLEEVREYRVSQRPTAPRGATMADSIVTPSIRMRTAEGAQLALFATVATFGTALEVTTSELSIELAFPADTVSADVLRKAHENRLRAAP